MIAVDTSVWIDVLSGTDSVAAQRCVELIEQGAPVAITDVVLTEVLFAAAGGVGAVVVPLALRARRRTASGGADRLAEMRQLDRTTWRMPPLHLLARPSMSTSRRAGLLVLRVYLVASALLVAVKVFGVFVH